MSQGYAHNAYDAIGGSILTGPLRLKWPCAKMIVSVGSPQELKSNWGINAFTSEAASSLSGEALRGAQVILVTYHRMLSDHRRAGLLRKQVAESGEKPAIPWEHDGIGEHVAEKLRD